MYDADTQAGYWLRARLADTLTLVGEGPGTVLDVGMGPGRLVAELARHGWTVWGIDSSPEMVALARTRAPGSSERLLLGYAENLPFADETFDAVVATGLMGYVDIVPVAREFARVLRPDGLAVVSFGNARSPTRVWRRYVLHPAVRATKRIVPFGRPPSPPARWVPGPKRLRALLSEAGLETREVVYTSFGVLPDPLDGFFPAAALSLARKSAGLHGPLRSVAATQLLLAAGKAASPSTEP
jgi:SAM-dependent methyltransferase